MAKMTASGEWGKEVSRDTAQKEHRQKDDTDAHRRNKSRSGDLRCAFQDAVMQFSALFQVPFDVFDGYRRIVDENANSQSQSAQRHDVDGFVQKAQNDNRGQNR